MGHSGRRQMGKEGGSGGRSGFLEVSGACVIGNSFLEVGFLEEVYAGVIAIRRVYSNRTQPRLEAGGGGGSINSV